MVNVSDSVVSGWKERLTPSSFLPLITDRGFLGGT